MRRNCRNHSTKNIGIDLLTLKKDKTGVCKTYTSKIGLISLIISDINEFADSLEKLNKKYLTNIKIIIMKKILLGILVLTSLIGFSQKNVVRQISYDTLTKYSQNQLKLKGTIIYDEYISKDGSLYKTGDTIKISKPSLNDKYAFINDRFTQAPATSKISGNVFIIKNIIVAGFKNTGYELCMTIYNPTSSDQILKFESAIENGEIKSKKMSSDDALTELKRYKDKLDLGLITQKEYDEKKTELSKLIK